MIIYINYQIASPFNQVIYQIIHYLGTSKGFNAMQLDVKINGLNKQQLSEALESGHKGILQILQLMNEAISEPRSKFKDVVPVIELMDAPLFKRSVLFRSSAYNAKLIESETGVKVGKLVTHNPFLYISSRFH